MTMTLDQIKEMKIPAGAPIEIELGDPFFQKSLRYYKGIGTSCLGKKFLQYEEVEGTVGGHLPSHIDSIKILRYQE